MRKSHRGRRKPDVCGKFPFSPGRNAALRSRTAELVCKCALARPCMHVNGQSSGAGLSCGATPGRLMDVLRHMHGEPSADPSVRDKRPIQAPARARRPRQCVQSSRGHRGRRHRGHRLHTAPGGNARKVRFTRGRRQAGSPGPTPSAPFTS
jgi:hypothetical protein